MLDVNEVEYGSGVPSKLEQGNSEDWLWRKDKPQRPEQPVDRTIFPAFDGFPDEDDIYMNLYESSDMVAAKQRLHWRFLAEIGGFAHIHRLYMEIFKVDGKKVPLFFFTQG